MVEIAEDTDPTWKPPALFAYCREGGQIYFEQQLPKLKNNIGELWESLPPAAQEEFFADRFFIGLKYARQTLKAAARMGVSLTHGDDFRDGLNALRRRLRCEDLLPASVRERVVQLDEIDEVKPANAD